MIVFLEAYLEGIIHGPDPCTALSEVSSYAGDDTSRAGVPLIIDGGNSFITDHLTDRYNGCYLFKASYLNSCLPSDNYPFPLGNGEDDN
jgi:hypothetical protein